MRRITIGNGRGSRRQVDVNACVNGRIAVLNTDVVDQHAQVAAFAAAVDMTGIEARSIECAFDQFDQALDGISGLVTAFLYLIGGQSVAAPDQTLQDGIDDGQWRAELM